MKRTTGVLLVNLGTPDGPSTPQVRKYLREFLMDGRVIDIPYWSRWLLVNLVIAPFRAPKSAKIYSQLWEERGSPLFFYGVDVAALLQEKLGPKYVVKLGMRYQSPSINIGLEELRDAKVNKIIIVPMFPQYASASTGSVIERVMDLVKTWQTIPEIRFVTKFFENELFIKAFAENGGKYLEKEQYDHILFSYHGIPERQILKASQSNYCQLNDKCCSSYNKSNQRCYRAQCFETSRLLASELQIPVENYTVAFQSRLGKSPWIRPYSDQVIAEWPKKGIKRVLVFSPSFIADCLETTIEGGEEFKEIFEEAGGKKWQLVESLNDSQKWVECLENMVLDRS